MTAPPNPYTLSWPTGGGHKPLGVKLYKGAPWLGKARSQATKHSMALLPELTKGPTCMGLCGKLCQVRVSQSTAPILVSRQNNQG